MPKHAPVVSTFPHLLHGGDYNPEQWADTPGIWAEDIRLLTAARCNVVSIGIFSWVALEAEEGKYTFDWLDQIIDRLTRNGTRFVTATPGGAKPAWMAQKYPEMLRVNARRERQLSGGRHNHCFTSPAYREKARQINTLLAERYGKHPNLAMWHVNNEYNGDCHCPLCQDAFRGWLQKRYDNDLKRLNCAWWTSFWSHTLTDWSQIESPSPIGEQQVHGHTLDWKRFMTDQTIACFQAEAAPLRERSKAPITANLMEYSGLNYYKLAQACDVVSWDAYPSYHERDADIPTAIRFSFLHDLYRSTLHKPFILMESAPAQQNYKNVCKLKRPGMHLLEAMQAVSHGSDSVMYFQWRKSRGGVEKFHGAVVDHHGADKMRVFKDEADLGGVLAKLDGVVGAETKADVAIIYDYENRWAIEDAAGPRKEKGYFETVQNHYAAFWQRGVSVDIVESIADFSKYKLLIAPMLYMLRPGVAEKIEAFVAAGGTFVATYFTGVVDQSDLCFLTGFPGPLRKLCGIWAEEIDTLYDDESAAMEVTAGNALGLTGTYIANAFCDLIHAEGATVLATYASQFYAGRPALTVNYHGKGEVYYVAARMDERFTNDFYAGVIQKLNITQALGGPLPKGVTAQVRSDGEREHVFILSFARKPHDLPLGDRPYVDAITGARVTGTLALPAYGARVLIREAKQH